MDTCWSLLYTVWHFSVLYVSQWKLFVKVMYNWKRDDFKLCWLSSTILSTSTRGRSVQLLVCAALSTKTPLSYVTSISIHSSGRTFFNDFFKKTSWRSVDQFSKNRCASGTTRIMSIIWASTSTPSQKYVDQTSFGYISEKTIQIFLLITSARVWQPDEFELYDAFSRDTQKWTRYTSKTHCMINSQRQDAPSFTPEALGYDKHQWLTIIEYHLKSINISPTETLKWN